MTNLPMNHLTEEELDDVLLGIGTAEAQSHLDTCELCTAQLAPFQTSVAAFNESSLAWAQAKSNTISRDLSTARLSTARRQPIAWAAGISSLAAIGFVLGLSLHRAPEVVTPASTTETALVDNAQEIAADNEMLAAINSELSSTAPAALQPFRATSVRSNDSRRTPAREVSN